MSRDVMWRQVLTGFGSRHGSVLNRIGITPFNSKTKKASKTQTTVFESSVGVHSKLLGHYLAQVNIKVTIGHQESHFQSKGLCSRNSQISLEIWELVANGKNNRKVVKIQIDFCFWYLSSGSWLRPRGHQMSGGYFSKRLSLLTFNWLDIIAVI